MVDIKEYLEVAIEINPSACELASDVLFSNFECEGVVTSTEQYKELELVSLKNDVVRGFVVAGILNEEQIKNTIKEQYETFIKNGCTKEFLGSWNVTVKKVENQDWSKKWKENWKPTPITDKITICPSWIEYTKRDDELVININPGAAFGTGTHATTQLCVFATEEFMQKDAKVADIGTGTGILSIIASKLGAKTVFAIDNDPVAIDAAVENAKINEVENCTFKTCEINSVTEQFDFVEANILHNVLAEIMGDLKRIMKDDAKMVLSGILNTKAHIVENAIKENDLHIIKNDKLDPWVSFVVEK